MTDVTFTVSYNTQDLAKEIVTSTIESDMRNGSNIADIAIFELIKALDLEMAEWEFTKRLHDYFAEEVEKS